MVIQSKINSDPTLSTTEREQLAAMVQSLSSSQQASLSQILQLVAGAGVGAAIARFLLRQGGLGTALGGALGALVASRLGANVGQAVNGVNNTVDIFGRPF